MNRISPQNTHSTAGFTLVEMIIVAAVMAILAGISAPPLVQFMQQRDLRNEQVTQTELRKAFMSYIEERGTLPDDAETDPADTDHWSQQLSRYTNLSPGQLNFDSWDRPRAYSRLEASEFVLGSSMPIFYATLVSAGTNRQAEGSTGIPVNPSPVQGLINYQAPTHNGWWSRISGGQTARIAAFTNLTAAGDDVLIKITDYPEKIAAYKTTLDRMQRIGEALDAYSKASYAEYSTICLTTTCNPVPENKVYYPRSNAPDVNDTDNLYQSTRGQTDLSLYNSGLVINNGQTNDHQDRRTSMINLMRILGLPDEYCCSALEVIPGSQDAITGKPQSMPFYYFSNPRARLSSTTCGTSRAGAADRKLPARITTRYTNTGSVNPTCG